MKCKLRLGLKCCLEFPIQPYRRISTFYITTPIFYVNAPPHLGHLYTALIADASHRFYILRYPEHSTIFSTGTDEHGLKVQQAASTHNTQVNEYCDQISSKYRSLFDLFGIQYTNYVRTTDKTHIGAVQNFWNCLKEKGFVYSGKYNGWYCVADETFLSEIETDITVGKDRNEIRISKESGHPVQWTEEDNFMFKLSSLRSDLLHWLKDEKRVEPIKFYKLLHRWISDESNIFDISISRPSNRIGWGVPVPNHPDQTIYVWLDALVNYLTVVGYPNNVTWPPSVHVCGKDILRFHGIYWPAFLIAAGLQPPDKLLIHSHWTVNDEKMSKSKNNVINPLDKIEAYTISGLRYFLLNEGVAHSDGNYSEQKVINMLNSELANTLGNLLNRSCGKTVNTCQQFPAFSRSDFNTLLRCSDSLSKLTDRLSSLPDEVAKHYTDFNFYKGIEYIITTLHLTNKFFEDSKPWILCKKVDDIAVLYCILHITLEALRICSIALQPIVPEISCKVLDKLGIDKNKRMWAHIKPSWEYCGETTLNSLPLNQENIIVFKRIESNPIIKT